MSLKRFNLVLCLILVLTGIYVEPAYAAILFSDGFESGDFSAWTGTTGTPIIVSDPVHHGSYAAEFNASGDYCSKTLGADYTTCYYRAYIRFDTLPPVANDFTTLMMMKDGATTICETRTRNLSGDAQIQFVWYKPSTDTLYYDANWSVDTWYCLEIKYYRHATLGEYRVYLDGVNVISKTAIDTTGVAGVDTIILGRVSSNGAWTPTIYGDCVVVADAYIGPEAGGPTNYPRSASQGITVGVDADRWFQGHRPGTQGIGVGVAAARLFQGLRGGAQAIGFTPDGERIYGAVRSPTQAITLASAATRILTLTRGATQALSFLWEADGVWGGITNYIRGCTQTIHFASSAMTDALILFIRVVDAMNQALSGATIAVWGPAGTLVGSGNVNTTGYYTLHGISPGNYTVQAVEPDYQTGLTVQNVAATTTLTLTLRSIEDAVMMYLPWSLFTVIGAVTLAIGYRSEDLQDRMTALAAATLFWLASLYMWVSTSTGSLAIFGGIVHLAPFMAGAAWFMQSLGQYIDDIRRTGGKRDPFRN